MQGCKVTAHDLWPSSLAANPNLYTIQGDISDEASIEKCITSARECFGPINILAANAGITDESNECPIWQMPVELRDKTYALNARGTFPTIKNFLKSAEISQELGAELPNLPNLAVVVTGVSMASLSKQDMESTFLVR